MAHTMRIRKGDLVHILSGKDRGKQGRVIDARPKDNKVIVENLNLVKRHTKPRPAPRNSGSQQVIPGGVIEKEAALALSNVQLVCPSCGKPSRVGYRVNEDGTKVRVCRNCGKDVDR